MTLTFDVLTLNQKRSFSGQGQYMCEVSLLYVKKKWACLSEIVNKSKVRIWPCPLTVWPHNQQRSSSGQGQYMCEVSSLYVKWERSYRAETTLPQREIDRQTDGQPLWNKNRMPHNFVGGGIPTHFQCVEIVEKCPPHLGVKITWR